MIRLTEIFRQAAQSKIVVSAHKINHGEMPELAPPGEGTSDFYFINRDDPEAARNDDRRARRRAHPGAVRARSDHADPGADADAPRRARHPRRQPRAAGAAEPVDGEADVELVRGDRAFRRNDKVMQLKNDYDRNVFNGDIGVIESRRSAGAT